MLRDPDVYISNQMLVGIMFGIVGYFLADRIGLFIGIIVSIPVYYLGILLKTWIVKQENLKNRGTKNGNAFI